MGGVASCCSQRIEGGNSQRADGMAVKSAQMIARKKVTPPSPLLEHEVRTLMERARPRELEVRMPSGLAQGEGTQTPWFNSAIKFQGERRLPLPLKTAKQPPGLLLRIPKA